MDMIKKMFDEELYYSLKTSSYAKKILKTQIPSMNRIELENLYGKAREYACESIASHLTTFDSMDSGGIYHLSCNNDRFYVLARVRTNYENDTLENTAKERAFLSFSILTEKNLSHFPGRVIYGYQKISPSMIGYICHHDADTFPYAETRLELSEATEELLDIEDLCAQALSEKTYCQVSIKTKKTSYAGPIRTAEVLLPSVVIAIDSPKKDDLLAAAQRKLPILVLHRSAKTIMHVYDMFFTPELSNPKLI